MGGGDGNSRHSYPQFDRKPRGPEVRSIYDGRLSQFTSPGEYSDVNLLSMMYHGRVDGEAHLTLEVYSPPNLARPLFQEAIQNEFRKTKKGELFGPSWSTHWFRVKIIKIPSAWRNHERVQLEFDLPEGLVYSEDGMPLQGITGGNGGDRRVDFILPESYRSGSFPRIVYIETSMNGMFGVGNGSTIQPPDQHRYFRLDSADLVCPNMEAWRLYWDFRVIRDLARELPQEGYESHEALRVGHKIMNAFDRDRQECLTLCRALADEILGRCRDSAEVYKSSEKVLVTAVGHCHIDTAWLWPFAETKRKIARSWSTQCDLMERYEEYVFTCSQAQQFKWLKQDYPKLFEKVRAQIHKGVFEPIGGTWTEMDTNIPSGESLCRQFLFGQRFFEKEFGRRAAVFWLPDTFGYSSQLPQLSRQAGMTSFFTQKLSWNNINAFPHTTFNWQALDGSQVLTHMAPDDTYTAQADLGDVLRSTAQHKNLSDDKNSLLVFGNGDGGGGPLAAMLENLRRCQGASSTNAPSVPGIKLGSVSDFFHKLEVDSDFGRNLRTWSGELYFEFHRGTYTSQALTKFYNRACERLLHDVEYLGTLATLHLSGFEYYREKLNALWEDVLLCQFHDVLPGSCIGMVYQDAHRIHENVIKQAGILLSKTLAAFDIDDDSAESDSQLVVIDTLGRNRKEIVMHEGNLLTMSVEDLGNCLIDQVEGDAKIERYDADTYKLSNANVSICIEGGCITSFYDAIAERELIPAGEKANQYQLYEDQPLSWQAWDVELYHLDKAPRALSGGVMSIVSADSNRVTLLVEHKISTKSWIKSWISLDSSHISSTDTCKRLDISCEVEWHENKTFLKVAFPTTLHASYATYETQFGIVQRPTHFNTTWDEAKFEVCCHKFFDLSEFDYGLSLLNDCKYGSATHGNVMRLSLLRAPKAPDDQADMGRHTFRYAMLAHASSLAQSGVVQAGYAFNSPLRISRQKKSRKFEHFKLHGGPNVILDTIKLAEDSDAIVLRYFEALGGRGMAKLHIPANLGRRVKSVWKTNLLEDKLEEMPISKDGTVGVQLRAFEVQTCLVSFVKESAASDDLSRVREGTTVH